MSKTESRRQKIGKNENSRTDILPFHRFEKVEFLQILEKNWFSFLIHEPGVHGEGPGVHGVHKSEVI